MEGVLNTSHVGDSMTSSGELQRCEKKETPVSLKPEKDSRCSIFHLLRGCNILKKGWEIAQGHLRNLKKRYPTSFAPMESSSSSETGLLISCHERSWTLPFHAVGFGGCAAYAGACAATSSKVALLLVSQTGRHEMPPILWGNIKLDATEW